MKKLVLVFIALFSLLIAGCIGNQYQPPTGTAPYPNFGSGSPISTQIPTPSVPHVGVDSKTLIMVYFDNPDVRVKQMFLENEFFLCHKFAEASDVRHADLKVTPYSGTLCQQPYLGCIARNTTPTTIEVKSTADLNDNSVRDSMNHELAHYLGLNDSIVHAFQDRGELRGNFGKNVWNAQLLRDYVNKWCT